MKRRSLVFSLCIALLTVWFAVQVPVSQAKKVDLVTELLRLPAPPPPNPAVRPKRSYNDAFFDRSKPPADDAPIEDLIEYWSRQRNTALSYSVTPSETVTSRLVAEIRKDHSLLTKLIDSLPDSKVAIELVKDIYDLGGSSPAIKTWLTYNSPYFSDTLERSAARVADVNEYVSNQNELLALTSVDFDRAKPIIDRLYMNGGQRVSQVLATWALYQHAMETGAVGDTDRYRDELKAVVEDKTATAGMRDLAFDALAHERDFPGRDEWYYSLLGDETLADLRVNGQSYTGLTTLIYYSPDDKYTDKMIELVKSDNKVIRNAAIKNLVLKLNKARPDVIRALVPWLSDKEWAKDPGNARSNLVMMLSEVNVPESVPGLIKMLDEMVSVETFRPAIPKAPMEPAAPVVRSNTNSAVPVKDNATAPMMIPAFRFAAIRALAKQKSSLAGGPLRRLLAQTDYNQIPQVLIAAQLCGGFTLAEEMAALDEASIRVTAVMAAEEKEKDESSVNEPDAISVKAAPMVLKSETIKPARIATAADIRTMLGSFLANSQEISDDLARAVIDRIESLDKTDPARADAYRRIVVRWPNKVVNSMLLRDLKNDHGSTESVIRLLATRKELRETNGPDIADTAAGNATARGIAACIEESPGFYSTIMESDDAAAKMALLACGRMIRARLPLDLSISLLKSENKLLSRAAESYLESEDSPAARAAVLALHPNEARIMGATTAFVPEGRDLSYSDFRSWMPSLFVSAGTATAFNPYGPQASERLLRNKEKAIQDELIKDPSLLGVYAVAENSVRIYRDRVIFSWDEDAARYRERPLAPAEFEHLKAYLTERNADEQPPFINCPYSDCTPTELLMLGRAGGRRIYATGEASPFFAGLTAYFDELKKEPATLKYALSREIPGLEIVFADDRYHAATVWKEGSDLRVAVVDQEVAESVESQLDEMEKKARDAEYEVDDTDAPAASAPELATRDDSDDEDGSYWKPYDDLKKKRAYDSLSWRSVIGGEIGEPASQPGGFALIPPGAGTTASLPMDQWKAKTSAIEVRCSEKGMYKIAGTVSSLLVSENCGYPVVSSDGKWALALLSAGENESALYRIDLTSKAKIAVGQETDSYTNPSAFIPSINKFLVSNTFNGRRGMTSPDSDWNEVSTDSDQDELQFIDALTGKVSDVTGEVRPLAQQTFRPLQKAAAAGTFWAAMPDSGKDQTTVGIYDIKTLSFRPMLTVPKIRFNSMSMWVDEPGNAVYFTYRGHLLKLPLKR